MFLIYVRTAMGLGWLIQPCGVPPVFSALAYCRSLGKLKWFDYIGIAVVATIAMVYTDTRLDFYANAVDDSGDVGHNELQKEKILKDDCFLWWMAMPVLL